MNIQFQRAKYTMFLFGFLFFFLIIDFAISGTSGFYSGLNRLLTAFVIFVVLISFFTMMYKTKKKDGVLDERDTMIQQKGTSVALLCTVFLVFLISTSVYVIYESSLVVPVSWLWFIAYITFSFAYFSSSTLIYFMYRKM